MVILYPIWLLLLIPGIVSLWIWKLPTRFLRVLRAIVLFLVILGMAGLTPQFRSRAGTVVVVVDRSLSMPEKSLEQQKELIELLQSKMGKRDQLAVVSFGQLAVIDRTPQQGKFGGFTSTILPDGSNLKDAIRMSLSLIPQGAPGRILLITDGKWTGGSPQTLSSIAATRGVALDYVLMNRAIDNDVAVSRIEAPNSVNPGQAFLVTAFVRSPTSRTIRYTLKRGGVVISRGTQKVEAGQNSLVFRDRSGQPGTMQYSLTIDKDAKDPQPENNRARLLVGVKGLRPILLVSKTPTRGLKKLLDYARIPVQLKSPTDVDWSLSGLSQYSGVILENVLAQTIGDTGMSNLAAFVKQTGAGLMITGGQTSFGPGGYYKSPLEKVLPVSMELRREHRKLSLAMAIVLDRSGSMSINVAGGKTKMDLANLGTVATLNLLGPVDELGVLAVDTSPHEIVSMGAVSNKAQLRQAILSIASMGGGIYVYEGLKAAHRMLLSAKAKTRHIILFSDAADSEQPGDYKKLLAQMNKQNITVSVIGLGTNSDPDAAFLKDIAKRGKGRVFFTQDARALPRLFAQDTFVVARSTFIKDPVGATWTAGLHALTNVNFKTPPVLGGYNLCYLRPGASQALVTNDKYKAPVIAYWQVGLGRALAYTGEIDGKYTGPIGQWSNMGSMVSSLTRWVIGQQQSLPNHMLLTQTIERGRVKVQLHLDPEKTKGQLRSLPKVYTVKGKPGHKPSTQATNMRWISPHLLQADIPLRGNETSISTVKIPGQKAVSLSPKTLMYSPEYRPSSEDSGPQTLKALSKVTSGKERLDVTGMWSELPKKTQLFDIRAWLFGLAILFFLLEILERRSGYVSSLLSRMKLKSAKRSPSQASDAKEPAVTPSQRTPQPSKRKRSKPAPQTSNPAQPSEPNPEPSEPTATEDLSSGSKGSMTSAFRKASKRAQDRTDRK